MSSSILLMFPECLSRSILNDWLPLTDVGHLDSAHCSNKARHQFLKLLSVYHVLGDSSKASSVNEYPILVWSIKRAVCVGGFTVSSKLLADDKLQETLFAQSGPSIRWITFEGIDSEEKLMTFMASAINNCSINQALHMNMCVLPTSQCDERYSQLTQSFRRLHSLNIKYSKISANGLKLMLQYCQSLRILHFVRCQASLPVEVALLPSLEQFSAKDCNVPEAVLFAIAANCPRMKHMDIFRNSPQASNEAVQAILQSCPLLQYTDVEYATSLSHELRVELARRRNFTKLVYDYHQWIDVNAELCADVLRVSPNLLELIVFSRPWLTDDVLAVCAQHCKSLESLYLQFCSAVTVASILAITVPGNKLNKLLLWGCTGLGDEAVLAVAQRCPRLKEITNSSILQVSSEAIVALAKGCPLLEKVNLENSQADDVVVAALAQHCPQLRNLTMWDCGLVTKPTVTSLRQQYPKLTINW